MLDLNSSSVVNPFQPHDRVRVKPHLSESFILPFRHWIKSERSATVLEIWENGKIKIRFDQSGCKKYTNELFQVFDPANIEHVPVAG